jgi:Zn-dependent protease
MATGKHLLLSSGTPEVFRLGLADITSGLPYSICFLLFLLTHEFGHYFTARHYRVPVSLPYLLPVYIPGMLLNIGSFGATIRIRRQPYSTGQYFDIGIAGPLAGFVVALGLLVVGFLTLPPFDEVAVGNPLAQASEADIQALQSQGADFVAIKVGTSLLFEALKHLLADPDRMPSHLDLLHYPFLFVGFLALFFTSLNLLPIGQLDGGHVMYGLLGRRWAYKVSWVTVLGLILFGGWGLVDYTRDGDAALAVLVGYTAYLLLATRPLTRGRPLWVWLALVVGVVAAQQAAQAILGSPPALGATWLLFALMGGWLVKLPHPPAFREHRLNSPRRWLGWAAVAIFVLCFSPTPLSVEVLQLSPKPGLEAMAPVVPPLPLPAAVPAQQP